MKNREIKQVIQQSKGPEEFLRELDELDDNDLIDKMKPRMRHEVETNVRIHSVGRRGLGGFNI